MKYFTMLLLVVISLSANAQVDSLVIKSGGEKVMEKKPEVMPRFISLECEGMEGEALEKCSLTGLLKFVYKNIKYPPIARENGVEGTVVVRFIVRKNGEITDAQVIMDIGQGCGEEAMRVVNMMPNWEPGTQDGAPVDVYFNLPIKYKLEGRKKKKKKKRKNKG